MRYLLLWLYVGLCSIGFEQPDLAAALGGSAPDSHARPVFLAYAFGNTRRNPVYGTAPQTLDFALVRDFTVTERTRFQFHAAFFNGLNHTNLGNAQPICGHHAVR